MNYVQDLREVARRYHFNRAADADMALWVLREHISNEPDNKIWRQYENDPFMLRLRAKNLMTDFLTRVPYPELANSLLETNRALAAQIAGTAFERMVRRRAPRKRQENRDHDDLSTLIGHRCRQHRFCILPK